MLVAFACLEDSAAAFVRTADVQHREPLAKERERPEFLHVDRAGAHHAPIEANHALPAVEGRAMWAALRLDDVYGKLAATGASENTLIGAADALHAVDRRRDRWRL